MGPFCLSAMTVISYLSSPPGSLRLQIRGSQIITEPTEITLKNTAPIILAKTALPGHRRHPLGKRPLLQRKRTKNSPRSPLIGYSVEIKIPIKDALPEREFLGACAFLKLSVRDLSGDQGRSIAWKWTPAQGSHPSKAWFHLRPA